MSVDRWDRVGRLAAISAVWRAAFDRTREAATLAVATGAVRAALAEADADDPRRGLLLEGLASALQADAAVRGDAGARRGRSEGGDRGPGGGSRGRGVASSGPAEGGPDTGLRPLPGGRFRGCARGHGEAVSLLPAVAPWRLAQGGRNARWRCWSSRATSPSSTPRGGGDGSHRPSTTWCRGSGRCRAVRTSWPSPGSAICRRSPPTGRCRTSISGRRRRGRTGSAGTRSRTTRSCRSRSAGCGTRWPDPCCHHGR